MRYLEQISNPPYDRVIAIPDACWGHGDCLFAGHKHIISAEQRLEEVGVEEVEVKSQSGA
jgi:hypothetical protein